MGKCKLATLQRLFESPSLPRMPPTAPSPHCLMLQGGGGEAFLCTPFEVLCVHC